MATQADVRRIALSLPGAVEAEHDFAFSVRNKDKQRGFVWVWKERVIPKKPRVPNHDVLAVRVATLVDKDLMITALPTVFFTEPHYDGFPAILVRLAEIRVPQLRPLIVDAWRTQAPQPLVEQFDGGSGARSSTKRAASSRKRR